MLSKPATLRDVIIIAGAFTAALMGFALFAGPPATWNRSTATQFYPADRYDPNKHSRGGDSYYPADHPAVHGRPSIYYDNPDPPSTAATSKPGKR